MSLLEKYNAEVIEDVEQRRQDKRLIIKMSSVAEVTLTVVYVRRIKFHTSRTKAMWRKLDQSRGEKVFIRAFDGWSWDENALASFNLASELREKYEILFSKARTIGPCSRREKESTIEFEYPGWSTKGRTLSLVLRPLARRHIPLPQEIMLIIFHELYAATPRDAPTNYLQLSLTSTVISCIAGCAFWRGGHFRYHAASMKYAVEKHGFNYRGGYLIACFDRQWIETLPSREDYANSLAAFAGQARHILIEDSEHSVVKSMAGMLSRLHHITLDESADIASSVTIISLCKTLDSLELCFTRKSEVFLSQDTTALTFGRIKRMKLGFIPPLAVEPLRHLLAATRPTHLSISGTLSENTPNILAGIFQPRSSQGCYRPDFLDLAGLTSAEGWLAPEVDYWMRAPTSNKRLPGGFRNLHLTLELFHLLRFHALPDVAATITVGGNLRRNEKIRLKRRVRSLGKLGHVIQTANISTIFIPVMPGW